VTVNEETDEIFESRTYRLRPTPEAHLLAADVLRTRMGQQMLPMPPEVPADCAVALVENTMIKFLAKRRNEDGHILHPSVASHWGRRGQGDGGRHACGVQDDPLGRWATHAHRVGRYPA
jgi:hypothetical protein